MTLFAYSFSSGITLIALAAVYIALLRNTTCFSLNRICLLVVLAVSMIVPFVTLPSLSVINEIPAEMGDIVLTSVVSRPAISPVTVNVLKITGYVYLFGVMLMAVRTLANFIFIFSLMKTGRKVIIDGRAVSVHNHRNIPPMSWGGRIFIAETLLSGDSADLKMILSHENAHRRRCHWLDLLLSNVVLAVNWYNPAAWIIQRELVAVHEYEADRIASGESGDKKRYQLLLIKKTAGTRFHAFADSLNHSSLKKRITMMMKNQSKSSARLRPFALLPAMAVAMLVSNSSCVKNAQNRVSETDPDENVSMTGDIRYQHNEGSNEIIIRYPGESENQSAPLVIIDGVEATLEDMKELSSSEIESVAVENDKDVLAKYGDRAAGGVVIVKTKVADVAESADACPVTRPEYPGGVNQLYNDLAEIIKWKDSLKEGRVVVGFTVDKDGSMTDFKVVHGLSPENDSYAIECLKKIKTKWTPGKDADGNLVKVNFVLPISFRTE